MDGMIDLSSGRIKTIVASLRFCTSPGDEDCPQCPYNDGTRTEFERNGYCMDTLCLDRLMMEAADIIEAQNGVMQSICGVMGEDE